MRRKKKAGAEFLDKLKRKSRVHVIPLIFLLSIVLFFIIVGGQVKKAYDVYSQIGDLKNKLAKTQEINANLEAQIETFGKEGVIDKEARERLNLKKEGENVVVIIPAEKQAQLEVQPQEQKNSFWDKFLNLFK